MSTSSESVSQIDSDSTTPPKPKNIIVLSDGTGNAGGVANGTNVWRIRQAIESDADAAGLEQVIIYEDGVGTSAIKPLQIIGLAFAAGITRDLVCLYARLIQVYNPGDRLYLFGFSRGAFTIRLFAFMLYRCGLADIRPNGKLMRPEQVVCVAKEAVGAFKMRHKKKDEEFRKTYGYSADKIESACSDVSGWREAATTGDSLEGQGRVPIRFIGVWDTVDAVGLPFDNLSQGLLKLRRRIWIPFTNWVLLNLGRRVSLIQHSTTHWREWAEDDDLHPCIQAAYHAVSIDDERQTFHPVLWLELQSDGKLKKDDSSTLLKEVEQVWFSGVHANVGGGYPKDHLAYVSLEWMMRHAMNCELVFDADRITEYDQERDELGHLYDSRSGGGIFYRYKPRTVLAISEEVGIDGATLKPLIHESVLMRIEGSSSAYAPFGAPEPGQYDVVLDADIPAAAKIDEVDKDDVENQVPRHIRATRRLQDAAKLRREKWQKDHPGKDEEHYERRWCSDNAARQRQSEARAFSQSNAVKLSDLRLCCYYAFCVWAVVFLATCGMQDFGNSEKNSADKQTWGEFAKTSYDMDSGPLAKAVRSLLGPFEALTEVIAWPSVIFAWSWGLVLTLAVAAFAIIIAIAIPKGLFVLFAGKDELPKFLHDVDLCCRPTPPSPLRVLFWSLLAATLAAMFQPVVQGAILFATPEDAEQFLRGVIDCRGLVAFFAFTLTAIIQVSNICKTRIREWSVYGWKMSLPGEDPIGPVPTCWERLGAAFKSTSWQGVVLERIVLPVGALTLVISAALFFVSSSIDDNKSDDNCPVEKLISARTKAD